MKTTSNWLLILVIVFVTGCSSAPQRPAQIEGDDYAYTLERMRWEIRDKMRERDIVGLSIALVDDDRVVWAEGFGYADKARNVPATADTVYRAGSITKLFTATAAMQLSEQGRMDIDQPLQSYLPEFSIDSRFDTTSPITPRLLMTHHSGLPSDRHNRMWGDETARFTDLVTALQDEFVATAPNTIGAYSNLGFSLLGHAVERASGLSYAEYIENRILRPTGMAHAYIAANLRDESRSSKGYFNRKEVPTSYLRDLPAGALNTSIVDLARFAQMTFDEGNYNGIQVLQAVSLAEMQRYQDGNAPFDVKQEVGLAWRLDRRFGDESGVVASHNGGTPMFFSEFLTLPKEKLAVVVLANSNTAAGVVAEIANETLALALETKTGVKLTEAPKLTSRLPVLAEDLERLPGAWSTPMGVAKIYRRGDRLKFEVNGTKLDLLRREDGHYHLQYKLLGLVPISLGKMSEAGVGYQNIAGRDLLTLYVDGKPDSVVAEKIEFQPLTTPWREHLGEYEVINAQGDVVLRKVTLSYVDSLLQAVLSVRISPAGDQTITEALRPVTDRQAVIYGLGRGKGETLEIVDVDGKAHLSYSGFMLRRID